MPSDDVGEVVNYVAALEHGLARLKEGFPLSNRLIREIHSKLLAHGRGSDKEPGEFRRSQNWIGGIQDVARRSGLTFPTAATAIELLGSEPLHITREITGKLRNRVFCYDRHLAILNEGTE